MGKSEGNALYLSDSPEDIRKKVMRAVSDSSPKAPNEPKSEPVQNLFALLRAVSTADTVEFFEDQYQACTIRYGDMKKQLAEDVIALTTPLREKIELYLADDRLLSDVAAMGAEAARKSAKETLRLAKEAMGIRKL